MKDSSLNRREFIQVAGAAASAAIVSACAPVSSPSPTPAPTERPYKIPRRALGQTGMKLSVVGFGGIVVMNETAESSSQLVARAIERDINYFDVAPSYGNAEERLGPALEPYRKDVFLACKTQQRTKSGAEAELKSSLERLRTDHFDLYQFHAVTTLAEVETIFGSGGAMEAFTEARERGTIRRIGFSAHSEAAALAMLDRFKFDTILYPINWVCWHQGNFGPKVVAKAAEQGLGILALKALARQSWPAGETKKWPKCWYQPVDTPEEVSLGLRFTLSIRAAARQVGSAVADSKPVTAAVCPSHAELLWMECDAAEKLAAGAALSAEEEALLVERSAKLTPLFRA